jgi:hypothetical protein
MYHLSKSTYSVKCDVCDNMLLNQNYDQNCECVNIGLRAMVRGVGAVGFG